ncbi:MAG TPA: PQQ-binding-like beta-propeller repeat protein, partial [Planctomycetota bacterium]|nr:PQQ-binding-like beta-propeller repeat protein [Planctomycetota bacterium]
LDAVIRCFDLDGNERWNWDHYKRCAPAAEELERVKKFTNINKHLNAPNFGGGEVAVSGRKVVAGMGWDVVCLEDQDKEARQVWVRRRLNEIGGVVSCLSVSGDNVHVTGQARDGFCLLGRLSLATGALVDDFYGSCSFPWAAFPVRGNLSLCRGEGGRLAVWTAGEKQKSRTVWKDPRGAAPLVASPVLAGGHIVAGTLNGELLIAPLAAESRGPPFTFKTPGGKGIGAAPAVSGGCVHFGCDDGYLYVLGPGAGLLPKKDEAPAVSARRSTVQPATGKTYGWPSNYGNAANTCFVDDPGLAPPFRVRWAVRAYGHFKSPAVTTEDGDIITVSYQRTVTCLEQATGRTRWRVRLPPDSPEFPCADGLLVADGRLYVPCPAGKAEQGGMLCLDVKDGRVLWAATMGSRADFSYMSPVLAGGKVAFASTQKGASPAAAVQAWDAITGAPAWKVDLGVTTGAGQKTGGCAADSTFYYTTGGLWDSRLTGDQKLGETVAIEASSGKVLWKTNEYWGNGYPVLAGGGRLLLYQPGKPPRLCCLSTKDGSLLWTSGAGERYMSVGADFIAYRYYGGFGGKLRLEDGKPYPGMEKGGQLGGTDHACTPVTLTPKWSLAPTADGLNVRDVQTGALVWHSPGFAPKTCCAVSLANGRAFMPTAASGMLFCWEPEK